MKNNKDVFNVDKDDDIVWQSQSLDHKHQKKSKKITGFIIAFILIAIAFSTSTTLFSNYKNALEATNHKISQIPQINNPTINNEDTLVIEESETNTNLEYDPIINISPETENSTDMIESDLEIEDDFYFESDYCDPENDYYCFIKNGVIKETDIRYEFFNSWIKDNIPWINEPNRNSINGSLYYLPSEIKYAEQKDLDMVYSHSSVNANDLYVINIDAAYNTITLIPKDSSEENTLDPLLIELKVLPITSAYNEIREGDIVYASIEIEKINKSANLIEGYLVQIGKQDW